MNYYHIYNIDWDTDGEDCTDILPTELNVNVPKSKIGEIGDIISDWLSDTFGYCHDGFDFEEQN